MECWARQIAWADCNLWHETTFYGEKISYAVATVYGYYYNFARNYLDVVVETWGSAEVLSKYQNITNNQ